ncbi:MAG: MFS transporter [Chloroflexi bacterium]|nr:MFS transporter [Chloroflexota bacterium]
MEVKTRTTTRELALMGLMAGATLLLSLYNGRILLDASRELRVGSPAGWGLLVALSAFTTLLLSIAAALLIDRRGYTWLIPVGCLLLAMGAGVTLLTSNRAVLVAAALVSGAGGAATTRAILLAIVAKWCYRWRGAAIGLVIGPAFLAGTLISPTGPLAGNSWSWQAMSQLAIAGALIAAVALYLFLPRGFPLLLHTPEIPLRRQPREEYNTTFKALQALPGFWKVAIWTGAVFALGNAIVFQARIAQTLLFMDSRSAVLPWGIALALGALSWGALADRWPLSKVILPPALLILSGIALAVLIPSSALLASVAIGLGVGAASSLPWILLADHLSVRYFAILGVLLSAVGGFLSGLVPFLMLTLDASWNISSSFQEILPLALLVIAFAALVVTAPTLALERKGE